MKNCSKYLILSFFYCLNIYSQENFEGEIVYSVDYKFLDDFKKLGMSEATFFEQLKEEKKYIDEIKYFFKGGRYLIQTGKRHKQVYLPEENNIYYFEDDLIIKSDASVDLETLKGNEPKVQLLEKTETIDNIKCNIVKVKWKLGEYYYYYNNNLLKTDYNLFINHNYDMWYKFLKISGALPIRIEKKIGNLMIVNMILKKHDTKNVSDSIFKIPKMKRLNGYKKYLQPHQEVYSKN